MIGIVPLPFFYIFATDKMKELLSVNRDIFYLDYLEGYGARTTLISLKM